MTDLEKIQKHLEEGVFYSKADLADCNRSINDIFKMEILKLLLEKTSTILFSIVKNLKLILLKPILVIGQCCFLLKFII